MFECIAQDGYNSNITLSHNIETAEQVTEIVSTYALHVKALASNQVMHVRVGAGVNIPYEQMFQIYLGVRRVHVHYKNVEELNVYLHDSVIVRCFKCLLGIVTPTVRINIHNI